MGQRWTGRQLLRVSGPKTTFPAVLAEPPSSFLYLAFCLLTLRIFWLVMMHRSDRRRTPGLTLTRVDIDLICWISSSKTNRERLAEQRAINVPK